MDNTIDRVESQRLQLEESIVKLQRSLRHWQTWEAEYDALREEVNTLPEDATAEDVKQLAVDFGSEVIKPKDVEELIGTSQAIKRSRTQIAALITRRIEYMQQNCKSAARLLKNAQAELEGGDSVTGVVADDPTTQSADIIEQLDDQDNIVSSRLAKPGEHADDIVNMLHKAGVAEHADDPSNTTDRKDLVDKADQETKDANTQAQTDSHESQVPVRAPKKSVTFAEDVQAAPASTMETDPAGEVNEHTDIKDIVKGSFNPDEKVWQLGEDDRPVDFHSPHVPADESPQDAALRRQMMEYNMQEVGAVVAELDLEDEDSEDGFSSDDEEIDIDSTTDEDEEDQYGRSLKSMVSDEYREKMFALEKKLNAQMMHNIGPSLGESESEKISNISGRQAQLADREQDVDQSSRKQATSKTVRFASDLDIAPTKTPPSEENTTPSQGPTDAVSGTIVERPNKSTNPKEPDSKPKKMSKFKEAQLASKAPSAVKASSGREASNTLSSNVVERPPREGNDVSSGTEPKVSRFKAGRMNESDR